MIHHVNSHHQAILSLALLQPLAPLIIPKSFSDIILIICGLKSIDSCFSNSTLRDTPFLFTPPCATTTDPQALCDTPSSFLRYFPNIVSLKSCIKSNGSYFHEPTLHHTSSQFRLSWNTKIDHLISFGTSPHWSFLRHFPDIFLLKIWFKSNGSYFHEPTLSDTQSQFTLPYQTTIDPQAHSSTSPYSSFQRHFSGIFLKKIYILNRIVYVLADHNQRDIQVAIHTTVPH